MKKQIVGMLSSYEGLNPSPVDWLWHQTPNSFGVWGNIQISALADQPDFLLLYNGLSKSKKVPPSRLERWFNLPKKSLPEPDIKTKLRGVPQERVIYLVREPPFPELQEKRISEYQIAQTYCGYVSGPDDFAPIPQYMPAIWYHANSFRDLDEMASPEKVSSCCWITSGIDRTNNHLQRLAFLKQLREHNLDFDLYGRDLPAWANGYGQVGNKWNVMAPYYYNLAIENYADNDWYVSEKLWDALLAWCLPIYYGGSAADKLLPPGSFIKLPSLDTKGLACIQEVIANPDAWYAAKEAIAEARQIILHKLNLLNWLSDITTKIQ